MNNKKEIVCLFENMNSIGISGKGESVTERLNKKEYLSPFNHNTDIRGFIKDIKSYLFTRGVDPKSEAENYIKKIIRENGFDDPDAFLKKFVFHKIVLKDKNDWK